MKWILIGHRGVGKTTFLRRVQEYFGDADIQFLDLDHEIESRYRAPLVELFPRVGEAKFREMELEVFAEIHQRHAKYVLSVGGGFRVDKVPKDELEVLWVRRKTDELGRIFTDRPRLNAKVSALQEYMDRYEERQSLYQDAATEVYWMPEGIVRPDPTERAIWLKPNLEARGILVLNQWHFRKMKFPRYGCELYELRDDLLDVDRGEWRAIPRAQRLLSFRAGKRAGENLKLLQEVAESDWALELGPCPSRELSIISCHERLAGESLGAFLVRLENSALPHQHLKAAPVIETYAEAKELLKWQQQEPARRSALPRSALSQRGKWLWLRLYLKGRQKMNFWRDSDGSAWDQPTLYEWLSTPARTREFAALLGDPVAHSRTMMEQGPFFEAKGWPVWPVLLRPGEFAEGLHFQVALGLRAAAVTSPLKANAYAISARRTPEAEALHSVNTLFVAKEGSPPTLHGHNTDLEGFESLVAAAIARLGSSGAPPTAVIWGGGGTLAVIEKVLPEALQLSVRTRRPRDPARSLPKAVKLLIWAAGPTEAPPPEIEFDLLVDLNYREDSRAREWALTKGKPYLSGEEMFNAQAAGQRRYWGSIC